MSAEATMTSLKDSIPDSDCPEVWECFEKLSRIPRPSRHEERIREWLMDFARSRSWEMRTDAFGNLIIYVPGCGDSAGADPLILQGHMDMVCEKNSDSPHDFMSDPILPRRDGDWIVADGTTLGADNGIAMAMALTVAAADMDRRRPLELLFTADEETGLNGAMQLDPAMIRSRSILNLDSEEDGVFIIGCAGGADIHLELKKAKTSDPGPALEVHICGFQGGHSGIDIHKDRENAILVAAAVLASQWRQHPNMALHRLSGGGLKNAIPRECRFTVSDVSRAELERTLDAAFEPLRSVEPDAAFIINDTTTDSTCVPRSFITMMTALPNGVLASDANFPDVIETSSSAGVAIDDGDTVQLLILLRSSSGPAKAAAIEAVKALCERHGITCRVGDSYPGWTPNPDSALLSKGVRVYAEVTGVEPKVTAIHAGLETGIIGDRIGSDDLLSVGPTIENAHSPLERLSIASTETVFRFLTAFVAE